MLKSAAGQLETQVGLAKWVDSTVLLGVQRLENQESYCSNVQEKNTQRIVFKT